MKPGWNRPCDNLHCVEVMETRTRVAVRNSAKPDGPWLMFSHDEWNEFLKAAKNGEFDL